MNILLLNCNRQKMQVDSLHLDFSDDELTGQKVACALYADQQKTKAFTSTPVTLKTEVNYKKEYDRNTENQILNVLKKNDNANDFSWASKIEEADEVKKAQGNMPEVGFGIVMILVFIGIMNYTNTFVVNIQSRMTELSVVESLGMTPKQLLGMLVREGIYYAAGAWMITLTVGLGITYALYESMNSWGIAFSVPLLPILAAVIISFLICIIIPVVTWIVLEKNGSVVERIKGVE